MTIKTDLIQRVDGETILKPSGSILQVVQVKYVMPYYHYENLGSSLFEIKPLRISINPKETTSEYFFSGHLEGMLIHHMIEWSSLYTDK